VSVLQRAAVNRAAACRCLAWEAWPCSRHEGNQAVEATNMKAKITRIFAERVGASGRKAHDGMAGGTSDRLL
jgi:hypothetical protein